MLYAGSKRRGSLEEGSKAVEIEVERCGSMLSMVYLVCSRIWTL